MLNDPLLLLYGEQYGASKDVINWKDNPSRTEITRGGGVMEIVNTG